MEAGFLAPYFCQLENMRTARPGVTKPRRLRTLARWWGFLAQRQSSLRLGG